MAVAVSTFVGSATDPVAVTAGIRSAIVAAGAGGTLEWSDREYRIVGAGPYTKILSPSTGQTWHGNGARIVTEPAYIGPWAVAVQADDVTLSGFRFTNADVTDAISIYVARCRGASIVGNKFTTPRAGGVHGKGDVRDLTVTGNQFTGKGYGVLMNDPETAELVGSFGWVVSNNVFDGGGFQGDGIELNRPAVAAYDVTVTGNVVRGYAKSGEDSGFGIAASNIANLTISDNVVADCERAGIHLEDDAAFVVISSNVVTGCGHAGIEAQVSSNFTMSDVVITGNVVRGCCTAPSNGLGKAGIDVAVFYTPDVGAANRMLVANNLSSGNGGHGIHAYQANDSVFSANICANNFGAGINLTSCTSAIAIGNSCTDSRSGDAKTQTYGLSTTGGDAAALYALNMLERNKLGRVDVSGSEQTHEAVNFVGDGLQVGSLMNTRLGFFGTAPTSRPAAVPVTAAGVHAALVSLGLIT